MDGHSAAISVESLLAHEPFVRGLARSLVRGDAEVDDVVQETWLSALKSPPKDEGRARGWLATVARNVVRQRARSERRRARREEAVARPEGAPSPASLREREAVRRRLVDAVLALEPNYRDPIVLHWFDGHPVPEVARRLGLPFETVRTRLRRGLERLRESLDARHGGDRRAWAVAFLPLAGLEAASVPVVASASTPILWAAAVLVVLGGVGIALAVAPQRDDDVSIREIARGVDPASTTASPLSAQPARSEDSTPATSGPTSKEPGLGSIRGIVRNEQGEPMAGAQVHAMADFGVVPEGLGFVPVVCGVGGKPTTTDARGRFEIASLVAGAYRVMASTPDGRLSGGVAAAAVAVPSTLEITILDSDRENPPLRIRVYDDHRTPVDGADVEVVADLAASPLRGKTERDGSILFPRLPLARITVTARSMARVGRVAMVRWAGDAAERPSLDVVVSARGAIEGRVSAAGPERLGETFVDASLFENSNEASTSVVTTARVSDDGTYRLGDLPATIYALRVRSSRGLRLDVPLGKFGAPTPTVQPTLPRVVVEPGGTTRADLRLVAGGAIRGVVTRASDGSPVPGASVRVRMAFLEQIPGWLPSDPRTAVRQLSRPVAPGAGEPFGSALVVTDDHGRYEASGLSPADDYSMEIVAPGLAFRRLAPVSVASGAAVEFAVALADAGTLELLLDAPHSFSLRPRGAEAPTFAVFNAEQRVIKLPVLAPGAWELCTGPDETPLRVIAPFEIHAGETTIVDRSGQSESALVVRVLAGGQPVVGADVGTASVRGLSDADGFVTLRSGWSRGPWTRVSVRPIAADALMLDFVRDAAEASDANAVWTVEVPRGSIEARVLADDGHLVPGAQVRLWGDPEKDAAPRRIFIGEVRRRTDGVGSARWLGVPGGGWLVSAWVPGVGHGWARVDVGESVTAVEIRLRPAGALRVVVVDRDGRPRPDVTVGLLVAPGADPKFQWLTLDAQATTDANGVAMLSDCPEGAVWVAAMRGIFPMAQVRSTVVAGSTSEVALTYPR